jgi:hypothetical protein
MRNLEFLLKIVRLRGGNFSKSKEELSGVCWPVADTGDLCVS